MATFAKIEDGYVVEVVKVDDSCGEPEAVGAAFLADLKGGEWVQTWYSAADETKHPRGKYAGIGDMWDGRNFTLPPDSSVEPVSVSKKTAAVKPTAEPKA